MIGTGADIDATGVDMDSIGQSDMNAVTAALVSDQQGGL